MHICININLQMNRKNGVGFVFIHNIIFETAVQLHIVIDTNVQLQITYIQETY